MAGCIKQRLKKNLSVGKSNVKLLGLLAQAASPLTSNQKHKPVTGTQRMVLVFQFCDMTGSTTQNMFLKRSNRTLFKM